MDDFFRKTNACSSIVQAADLRSNTNRCLCAIFVEYDSGGMMATNHFHLAQINFARMLAPLADPIMADFVALRDEINRLGDAAPGFVWRSQSSESNEMAIRIFDDTYLLVQLSVWESVEALYTFAYRSQHA